MDTENKIIKISVFADFRCWKNVPVTPELLALPHEEMAVVLAKMAQDTPDDPDGWKVESFQGETSIYLASENGRQKVYDAAGGGTSRYDELRGLGNRLACLEPTGNETIDQLIKDARAVFSRSRPLAVTSIDRYAVCWNLIQVDLTEDDVDRLLAADMIYDSMPEENPGWLFYPTNDEIADPLQEIEAFLLSSKSAPKP